MSDVWRRLSAVFVAPAEGADAAMAASGAPTLSGGTSTASRAAARAAVVVLGGTEAGDVAVAVAARLSRAGRTATALVCVHGAPVGERPAAPRAAAAAAKLRARGHDARARGRVVVVALGGARHEALAEAARAAAAVASGGPGRDVPVVLAITGPRDEAIDARLAEQDVVVLSAAAGTTGDAVAGVAAARLRAQLRGPEVVTVRVEAAVGPIRPGLRAVGRAVLSALG